MQYFWEELLGYFESGGIVMPPLALATVILWYALGYRYMVLQRGNRRSARVLIARYLNGYDREPVGIVDSAVVKGLRVLFDNRNLKGEMRALLDDQLALIEGSLYSGKALIVNPSALWIALL